ncbi:MAG: hypothetical protein OEW42_01410 [Acidimicrobiia bacterium]|nr:hypothetical protein [Acidimicrobiia bacterium]MDH5236111.1 hypothetical protein [Acidimicrobiia bacterium]
MFKRVIWTGVGYGLGLSSSIYVQRKVRRAVENAPEKVRSEAAARSRAAADRAKVIATEVRAVVRESRRTDDPATNTVDLRERNEWLSRARLGRRSA